MKLDGISENINIVVTPQRGHKLTTKNDRSNTQNLKDVVPIITQAR